MTSYDAVVVGSGPNGLAAAVRLAGAGARVLVLEGGETVGGGTRTAALTLPGYRHDVCSGAHPMGILSPFFRSLPLEEHGLRWIQGRASAAHPLDDGPAVLLYRSVEDTAAQLGGDAAAYRALLESFLRAPDALFRDLLAPLGLPRRPLAMARFGALGIRSAAGVVGRFRGAEARALFGGCAGHSILPLDRSPTAAFGLIFLLAGHVEEWPVAEGGSEAITSALASLLRSLGGTIRTRSWVRHRRDLPPAKVFLFDTSPGALMRVGADLLPGGYLRRLARYRHGPGTFKVDWALEGPIPWRDPRCLEASTVHVGGTFEEVAAAEAAVWAGKHPERPFVLALQQSDLDPSRAPEGRRTGYAYCHVPAGSDVDATAAVEAQIERFAPGFRDRILARHVTTTRDFESYNPNYVGGAIAGGVADLRQLFFRPTIRLDPYSTPNPRLFLCSAATPPGGGVHGMCGYYAAGAALRRLAGLGVARL